MGISWRVIISPIQSVLRYNSAIMMVKGLEVLV